MRFLVALGSYRRPNGQRHGYIKLYNVLGFPTETEDDWMEIADTVAEADGHFTTGMDDGMKAPLGVHNTPFRAMPATPCATWPMSLRFHRHVWSRVMQRRFGHPNGRGEHAFFEGRRLLMTGNWNTEALSSVMLDVLILRGEEQDSEAIRRLVATRGFWTANAFDQAATLVKHTRVEKLMGEYTWDTLPSRNILTYVKNEGLARTGEKALVKLGYRQGTHANTQADGYREGSAVEAGQPPHRVDGTDHRA